MKISNIKITKNKRIISHSAYITFMRQKTERMYFETNAKNESFISADYSPFLAAVLLPCMKTGEDIIIEGTVSEKLLKSTEKIMNLVAGWNVGLKRVSVIASKAKQSKNEIATSPLAPRNDKAVGSFFSAGVDSFYTYLKHKNKSDEISDLILVHGFDIPLQNKIFFAKTRKVVEKISTEEKINAIFVTTNAGEIIEKVLIWDFAHGGALAAVGLFLGKKFEKIFIPAGLKRDEDFPYGTHPDLDKLWSTENTQFVHDGTEHNRLGKIMSVVSKSDLALKYLRVCTQNIKGKYNCGKCYKCLQTMIGLVCADALSSAATFGKLDLRAVQKMYYDYKLKYNLQGEVSLEVLRRQKREPALQSAIEESLDQSKKVKPVKELTKLLAVFDQKYNNRRVYRALFNMNKNQDRNFLFKYLLERGVFK